MSCVCSALLCRQNHLTIGSTYWWTYILFGVGTILTPVNRHIGLHHRFDNTVVSFRVLEVIPQILGVGNGIAVYYKKLWIERLNALSPPGLNEMHSYKPFLWNWVCRVFSPPPFFSPFPILTQRSFIMFAHPSVSYVDNWELFSWCYCPCNIIVIMYRLSDDLHYVIICLNMLLNKYVLYMFFYMYNYVCLLCGHVWTMQ